MEFAKGLAEWLAHSTCLVNVTHSHKLFLEWNQRIHFSATSKQFLAKRLQDLVGNETTRNSWLEGCHHSSEL